MSVQQDSTLATYRFELERALRAASHLISGDTPDTGEDVRQLARAVVALSRAVDDLLRREEQALEERV